MHAMSLVDAIAHFAEKYEVPSQIVYAVAKVESNNAMLAIRYEARYRWMWDCVNNRPFRRVTDSEAAKTSAPLDFPRPPAHPLGVYSSANTEWHAQRTSWGPFQMMGAVLREAGYNNPFPELCADPSLAALWGCRHLSHLRDKYWDDHGWAGVVAAYNAGRPRAVKGRYKNQEYVNSIARAGAIPFVAIG
jgi:hypothetical protein